MGKTRCCGLHCANDVYYRDEHFDPFLYKLEGATSPLPVIPGIGIYIDWTNLGQRLDSRADRPTDGNGPSFGDAGHLISTESRTSATAKLLETVILKHFASNQPPPLSITNPNSKTTGKLTNLCNLVCLSTYTILRISLYILRFLQWYGETAHPRRYIAALKAEIRYRHREVSSIEPLQSIYFGGGTPSATHPNRLPNL